MARLWGQALAIAVCGTSADAATLRAHVVVNAAQVRLGDLFDGLEVTADTVLFRAPAPGKKIVLKSKWLVQVARYYKVDWRPNGQRARSVVERGSNPVDAPIIGAALAEAMRRQFGAKDRFEVNLDDPMLRIHLPAHMPAMATVRSLQFDRRTRRFSAAVSVPDDRQGARRIRVTGRMHRIVDVPVLTRRVRPGELIRRTDLTHVALRADRVDRNVVLNAEDILGKSPRRILRPERPVRRLDIREPMLVKRGRLVTMIYRSANMTITAKGKARGSGAKGDSVRVRNVTSGKTVEAEVVGLNQVSVTPASTLFAR